MVSIATTVRQIAYRNYTLLRPHAFKYSLYSLMSTNSSGDGAAFPTDEEITIPKPKVRENETMAVKRARLLYQSRKRGTLENGLLLSTFAAKYLDKLSDAQIEVYDNLINQPSNDWDIYSWATGNKPIPLEYQSDVIEMLKEHAQNKDREARLTQPALYK